MNKTIRFLEILWLLMGFAGIAFIVYSWIKGDKEGAVFFLIFVVVCGIMYALRRRQRISLEKHQKKTGS